MDHMFLPLLLHNASAVMHDMAPSFRSRWRLINCILIHIVEYKRLHDVMLCFEDSVSVSLCVTLTGL